MPPQEVAESNEQPSMLNFIQGSMGGCQMTSIILGALGGCRVMSNFFRREKLDIDKEMAFELLPAIESEEMIEEIELFQ